MGESDETTTLPLGPIEAVIFDTDGVITRTASVHRASWAALFDAFLAEHATKGSADDQPRSFSEEDYLAYVDGRPRYDGVATFLASRDIHLPYGAPTDGDDEATVCGLGNRKNGFFRAQVADHGVEAYQSTVDLIGELARREVAVAAVSASENQRLVLDAAGLTSSFDALVDGVMARDLGLAGKPDPALFLEAAKRLEASPDRSVVVEDARPGVAAGRAGDFGVVVGVDRRGRPEELRRAGADVVVRDLVELTVHTDQDGNHWLQSKERP